MSKTLAASWGGGGVFRCKPDSANSKSRQHGRFLLFPSLCSSLKLRRRADRMEIGRTNMDTHTLP
eukprot:6462990-Amphidinium_carterae.1